MIPPEARARLAEQMEERRLELRLTWREVAEAGGISYEVIRNLRNGRGTGIAPLTKGGIETGLRWEAGSVDLILGGGDPMPADEDETPPAVTPPRRERRLKALEDSDPEGLKPLLQDVRREVYTAAGIIGMFPPGADLPGPEDLPELEPLLDALPGDVAFPDSTTEPAVWETRDRLSVPERIRLVARIRHMAAKHAGGQRDRRVSGLTPWHEISADGAVPSAGYQAGAT